MQCFSARCRGDEVKGRDPDTRAGAEEGAGGNCPGRRARSQVSSQPPPPPPPPELTLQIVAQTPAHFHLPQT
jgi:hypothetical protein